MKRLTFLGLIFILLIAALGELIRLPIATENGILPNDLIVGALAFIWITNKTIFERKWPKSKLWAPFLTFIAIAMLSLLNASRSLGANEIIASSLYLIRFGEYFLITFMVLDLAKNNRTKNIIGKALLVATILIAIVGFLQLKWFPDFTELQDYGWDPHIDRLLSTWFDPNFVGGLLAFIISITISKSLHSKGREKITFLGIAFILLIALFLTYSRSAYLALIAAIGIIGLIKSRKLILYGLIAVLILVAVSDRAQERMEDAWHSAKSLIATESIELPDATARLRIESWQNAVTIISDHPWLGVGYNTYSYVQSDYGFVKELDKHSSTGSDSTLLTILATTGFLGGAAYLWILATILWQSFKNRNDGIALGVFSGTCGILIHSIFVNSLLFTPFLIFFYTGVGLALAKPKR